MPQHSDKAALRGEPSYVWRAGQERRLRMICEAAPMIENGRVLVDGCGVGMYVERLGAFSDRVHGLDIEFDRVAEADLDVGANGYSPLLVCGAGECLPYASESFDAVLSHEVIEHVNDDAAAVREIVRVLRSGGRLVLFCPNRWYPVETHGVYWRGRYLFGNIPLVNYLPDPLRNRLAPHVRAYTGRGLRKLFGGLPVRIVRHSVIFGGYDNLIARLGPIGKLIRGALYLFENTPLQLFGLSHFLIVEKL
ncbi:MAG: class I SAM-dependent methyltransferase [Chloroflexota bacterium]